VGDFNISLTTIMKQNQTKKKSQQRTLRTDTAYLTAPVQYTLILIDCNGMKLEINDERNYIKHSKHMETEYIA
jgi:hypothetical protein